ncbi:hypothetical protein CR513_10201, partial [Mucuna pruriens]
MNAHHVNYVGFDEEHKILLMSYVEMCQHHANSNGDWFLDSRCSNHMCGDKSKFNEIDGTFKHSVKLGNNRKMKVLDKRKWETKYKWCHSCSIRIFYVPKLKNNLFEYRSIARLGANHHDSVRDVQYISSL